ncbi:ABC transporter ATP-binding protein [Nocardia vulneris]|uniref:ABC transporter n=1 Tax=Nocardia vulneris TaxID=1141657 RepID=A0ABR4ZE86_9NOCA|nr:ATP-binding cassette domain-containing protein [Nocardia vulneris]KIA63682.1 ABC transporter [Nocardia vulneris]
MAERGRDAAVRDSVLEGGLGVDGDRGRAESADRLTVPSCPVLVEGLAVHGPNGQELFGPLDFRIATGSVAALTGPSGAGKTTLMRALLGDLPRGARRSGSVVVADHDVFALNPAALQRFRRTHVAYVGQDPGSALNPLMRVHGLLHEVAPHAARAHLVETLELVGLSPEHLRRRAAELSGGQQRRVALARALIRQTDVLILDEPLAGLHGALRTDIARLLTEVAADRSVAVLLSGHDTATIHAVADQVIELGAVSAFGSPDRPAAAALISPSATVGPDVPASDRVGPGPKPLLLRGNAITAAIAGREVLTGIDVELAAGSALAVVGASGAGKTTLARVLAGLHRTATGTLELHGASLPLTHGARKSLGDKGIQLVTQNPRSALNPRRTVAQTLGRPLRRIGGVPKRRVAQHVTDLLAAVELAPELAQRYPHELSGGQRQRVAVARALAAEPAVLLCDEITSALDHATAAALMALLDRIRAERAMGLLVISHDMALVAAYCPRLVVLDHGRIVESGETAAVLAAPAHQATRDLLR